MNRPLKSWQGVESRRVKQLALAVSLALAASSCATLPGGLGLAPATGGAAGTGLAKNIPPEKLDTVPRKIAAEALRAMDAGDWRKASDLLNLALKTDITNSSLQLLNAYAYHQRGRQGESGLLPLAEEGYQLAVQFDPSNWIARYFHGLLAMDQRDFGKAQNKLAEAALYAGNERDLLYDLATASYYAQDPVTAAAALEGLRRAQGGAVDARTLRASAIVAAAIDERDRARDFLDGLRKVSQAPGEVALVEQRVATWRASHEREPLQLAQAYPGAPGYPGASAYPGAVPGFPGGVPGYPQAAPVPSVPGAPGAAPAAPPVGPFGLPPFGAPAVPGVAPGARPFAGPGVPGRGPADFVEKNMVAIDVVIIGTEEDLNNRMGVNLLDGLRLQFGNTDTRTPGYSRQRNRTTDYTNPINSIISDVVTRLITLPAVTYTLNIANSDNRRNEVLAQPTLAALGGQASQFFSGVDINAAAVSPGQGLPITVNKEVGVKLAVTPEFLPDELIRMQVVAERTFLTNPAANVIFDYRLDTTKTIVNANVVMRFGETLILSGLSERDTSRGRTGVPLLQDIPVVQYLFSQRTDRDYFKSVLIMLTPRRPQYTYRDPAVQATERAKLNAHDRAVAEFEDKYREWFQPLPATAMVFKRLNDSPLYREFRSGDLSLRDWNSRQTAEQRLKTVVDFLYF